MSLDSPSDNAMTALYRVALGPVNTDYYLPVFARFDTTGRTTTSWNWAASLATLNWMVFRQVWSGALAYVAVAEGLALLVFALGRQFLNWPQGVELGVLAAFAMLAFAVPGLYGNAILHADIRRRISRALAASRTVPEACALLEQRASSRKRLQAVVGANVALALVAVAAYLSLPSTGFQSSADTSMTPAVTVAQASAAAAASAAASGLAQAASAPPEAAPASAPTPQASAPSTAPERPSAVAAPTPAPAAAPPATTLQQASPSAASAAKAVPAAEKPASDKAAATKPGKGEKAEGTPAAPAARPEPSASKPAAPASKAESKTASKADSRTASKAEPRAASKPAAAPERAARTAPASGNTKAPAAATAAASAASAPASAPLATVGSAAGYYINVGLFADEANARKAQARLLNEGLPAFRQELNNSKGRRIRVRVGPYDSRAQAAAAAESIRAMDLEAVVFKQ